MIRNVYAALRTGMWVDKRGWCHFMPDWYTKIIWRNVENG